MIKLSVKAKESIKTALAMTIAFGVALYMDWEKPYWAGFAVAFISMATIQQSLNKGLMRMLGTLMAAVAALTLVALFPQQRWWFITALSAYVGLCAYMMTGSRIPYFYQVGAFVCVIICFDGGVNSLNAFQTTVARIQETAMGILVYILVSVFLWPQRVVDQVDDSTEKDNQKKVEPDAGFCIRLSRPDQKRLKAALEVVLNLWFAFLLWIYVDPPGHMSFVIIVTSLSLGLVRFPSAKAASMLLPAAVSCVFSGILYIFVMPLLSGYTRLGVMIFASAFVIGYMFYKPRLGIYRAFGLAFFVTLTSISNRQTYGFSGYANSTLMIILAVLTLMLTQSLLLKPQLVNERLSS